MKKTVLTIALAFGIAFPMTATAAPVDVPEYVIVKRGFAELYFAASDIHAEERCKVSKGTKLKVIGTQELWLKVSVLERQGIEEFHHCHPVETYFVWRNFVVSPSAYGATGAFVQQTNTHEVFTGGRWGNEVPVFNTRGAYYSARSSMDRSGHYNGQEHKMACSLSVGTAVEFKPFRDWGTGEVRYRNCSGWTDREVIR